jgi:hypothetical protein
MAGIALVMPISFVMSHPHRTWKPKAGHGVAFLGLVGLILWRSTTPVASGRVVNLLDVDSPWGDNGFGYKLGWGFLAFIISMVFVFPLWESLFRLERSLYPSQDAPPRSRFVPFKVALALVVGASLELLALMFAAALARQDEAPAGVLDGLGIWPTQAMRFIAVSLSLGFLVEALRAVYRDGSSSLRVLESIAHEENFVLVQGDLASISEGSGGGSPPSSTSFPRRVLSRLKWAIRYRLSVIGITQWSSGKSGLPALKTLIEDYDRKRMPGARFARVLPNVLLCILLLGVCFRFEPLSDILVRGRLSKFIDGIMVWTSLVAVLLLLFFVIDVSRLCQKVLAHLVEFRPNPGEGCGHARRNKAICRWYQALVLFVGRRTEIVGKLIRYPAIVLCLLLLSRSTLLSPIPPSLELMATYLTVALGALYSGVVLRLTAERLRKKALAKLRDLDWGEGPSQEEARALASSMAEIEENRTGAFCPLRENPLIHAVLIPFGGMGAVEIVKMFSFVV